MVGMFFSSILLPGLRRRGLSDLVDGAWINFEAYCFQVEHADVLFVTKPFEACGIALL